MFISVVILAVILFAYSGSRVHFWHKEGKKLLTTGYTPPAGGRLSRYTMKGIATVAATVFLGRVRVIGSEHAHAVKSVRTMIIANHSFDWDFLVTAMILPFCYRQIAKMAELRSAWRAPLAAWLGFIGIDVERGRAATKSDAEAAVNAYARALAFSEDSKLTVYPEGLITYSGQITKFKSGAIRGLQAASQLTNGEELFVLPLAIHYHKKRNWSGIGHFFSRFGGVTVVIGKPIPLSSLPASTPEATTKLRDTVQSLLVAAKQSRRESVEADSTAASF